MIASSLLEIGAVVVSPDDPFTWASGIKSPVYCDNRISIGYPLIRKAIREAFEVLLVDWLMAADVIVGTATAGIPHAAWLAESRLLPMAYVRSSAKGHGKRNQIEGPLPKGSRVVVIEDLISTGGSSIAAVEAVRGAGAIVLGVGSIFTYELPVASSGFETANVQSRSLTDISALLAVARETGSLTDAQVASVRSWQQNPGEWKNPNES